VEKILVRRVLASLGDCFDLGEVQVKFLETRADLSEGGRFLYRYDVSFQGNLERLYYEYREARVVSDDFRRFPPELQYGGGTGGI